MKFKIGDTIDTAHCIALKHEFLRCEDAFKDFETYGTLMIMKMQVEEQGQEVSSPKEKQLIAYKTYNAYSRFIHYLYEFLLGAVARELGNTATLEAVDADRRIMSHTQRVLTARRKAIQNGTAPPWENHISYFPKKVPAEFAQEFRRLRNKISAHVTHERAGIDLTGFYRKNHKFVHMLYWHCRGHWGLRNEEFPDLKEITRFSVLIKKGPQT